MEGSEHAQRGDVEGGNGGAGGIDGIDGLLRSLPEILISVIVIIVAYFIWRFFNSEVGKALSATTTELVSALSDMLSNWRFFLLGFVAVKVLLPLGTNVISFFATRAETSSLRRQQLMLNDPELQEGVQRARRKMFGARRQAQDALRAAGVDGDEERRAIHEAMNGDDALTPSEIKSRFAGLDADTQSAVHRLSLQSREPAADILQIYKNDPTKGVPPASTVAKAIQYVRAVKQGGGDTEELNKKYPAAVAASDALKGTSRSAEAITRGIQKDGVLVQEIEKQVTHENAEGRSWATPGDGATPAGGAGGRTVRPSRGK